MSYKITVIGDETPPVQTVNGLPQGTRFQVEDSGDWYMRSDETEKPAMNMRTGFLPYREFGHFFVVGRVLPPEAVLQIGPEVESDEPT